MAHEMSQTIEPRVVVTAKTPRTVREALEELAREDDRPLSNLVARLLEESPRVQAKIAEMATREQAAA
jgi:hypothetical protein